MNLKQWRWPVSAVFKYLLNQAVNSRSVYCLLLIAAGKYAYLQLFLKQGLPDNDINELMDARFERENLLKLPLKQFPSSAVSFDIS